MVSGATRSLELLVSGALVSGANLSSKAVGLWSWLVSGVGWSMELVSMWCCAVCLACCLDVLFGFRGCGVVVWCQGGGSLELLVS